MNIQYIAIWDQADNFEWYNFKEISPDFKDMKYYPCVFVLWDGTSKGNVLKVEKGIFSEKIIEYQSDPDLTEHSKTGNIKITWALFPDKILIGVEGYLFKKLKPRYSTNKNWDYTIPVNLP